MENKNLQQNNDTVVVFIAKFDKAVEVREVKPALRNEVIQRCTDTLAKQQRYCVWLLLDYALRQRFGKGVADLNFSVDANGKWHCDGVYFSLTHCDRIVAVAVCHEQVGIDIEAVASFNRYAADGKFVERVLTNGERAEFESISAKQRPQALATFWTRKESLFKLEGGGTFVPKLIDTICKQQSNMHCQFLHIDGVEYSLAVAMAGNGAVDVKVVEDESIK